MPRDVIPGEVTPLLHDPVLDLLRRGHELIADPCRWCRSADARTARHIDTDYFDPNAASWCTRGALLKCAGGSVPRYFDALEMLNQAAAQILDNEPIWSGLALVFNDTQRHGEVMRMWRKAIAMRETQLQLMGDLYAL